LVHVTFHIRDFRDGAQCLALLEAVGKSIEEGKWAKMEVVE